MLVEVLLQLLVIPAGMHQLDEVDDFVVDEEGAAELHFGDVAVEGALDEEVVVDLILM